MRLVALLLLCGCDKVITFDRNPDAGDFDPDALDAAPTCSGVDPHYDTYLFSERTLWGNSTEGLSHPTVAENGAVYFTTIGGSLFVGDVDSTMVTGIQAETGFVRLHPSLSHDGQSLYFQRRELPAYVPVDVRRWTFTNGTIATAVPVAFTLTGGPALIDPGTTAMYDGKLRMVAWATSGSTFRLVEFEAATDDVWTEVALDTMPWRRTTMQELDPALSPDGCNLVFVSNRSGDGTLDLYYSWRGVDGVFASPVKLDESSNTHVERGFTIAPDGRLWYLRGTNFNQANQQLFVGTPPQ